MSLHDRERTDFLRALQTELVACEERVAHLLFCSRLAEMNGDPVAAALHERAAREAAQAYHSVRARLLRLGGRTSISA